MPRLLTDQELASTDAMWDSYNSKVDNLSKRKEEKVNRLGSYIGDPKLAETGVLADNGKLANNLTGDEFMGMVGSAYANEGLLVDDQGMYRMDGDTRMNYDGPATWLYMNPTKGSEEYVKPGISNELNPDDRYEQSVHPDWNMGSEGADTSSNRDRMRLLLPTDTAYTLEALGASREPAQDDRLINQVGRDKAKELFGGGFTEYFDSAEDYFGASESREPVDYEDLQNRLEAYKKQVVPQGNGATLTKQAAGSASLGSVSGKYESSGDASAVNADDQGAPSYGKYQLSVAAGTMQDFLSRPEGQKLRNLIGNLDPASGEFQARFKKAMQSNYGKDLLADQQEYIQNTHYEPVAKYAEELGIDTSIPAVQEMLWSQSVQHSGKGNKVILDTAMANLPENASYEDLVKNVYDARNEYARKYIANPTDIAADRYTNEQNDVLAMLSQQPATQEKTDESDFDRRLRELIEKDSRSNLTGVDKVVDEAAQTLSSIAANVAKGIVEIADVGQELATYPIQAVVRAYKGDSNYDIDLLGKEDKEGLQKFIDSSVGYDRDYDEKDVQFILNTIEELGLDITSIDSIEEAYSRKDFWDKMGDIGKTIATNPSLTIGAFAEILGSGLGLGATVKTAAKVGSKIAPKLSNVVGKALQLNKTKTDEAILAVKAKNLSKAEEALEIRKLDKAYTFNQKVVDGIKGSSMVNADFAVRMNTDIEEYAANNDGNYPGPQKMLEMAVLNKLMASAEVGALKSIAKANVTAGKEALKGKIAKASALALTSIVKGTLVEGTQETVDGIVQNINQKLDSKKYENYTVEQIISEASADILTGTAIGAGAGMHLGVATEVVGPTGKAVVGYSGDKLRGGLDQAKKLADASREKVKSTKEFVSEVKDDFKGAFGGEEQVNENLQTMGSTPEERKATLDSEDELSKEEIAAEVNSVLSGLTGEENGRVTTENAEEAADRVISSTIDTITSFNEELSSRTDISDAEKEELAGNNTHANLNNVASLLAAMRASGRGEEAAHLSKSLLTRMPNMVKYFGTNPEAVESFTSAVVREAIALNDTLTQEDIDTVKTSVRELAKAGSINEVNLKDIEKAIDRAVNVGEAYKTLSGEKTTENVTVDSATGERGFLTYFNGYSDAISKGDTVKATGYAEQLSRFMSLMEGKASTLTEEVLKAEAEVNKLKLAVTAEKGNNLSSNDLRAAIFARKPEEGITVDYGTGSKKTFEIRYEDVIDRVLGEKDPSGVYKVLENLSNEIEAMGTLSAYATSNIKTTAEKEPDVDVELQETEVVSEEPVEVPESNLEAEKAVDYSGQYTNGEGSEVELRKSSDGYVMTYEGKEYPRTDEQVKAFVEQGEYVKDGDRPTEAPKESANVVEEPKESVSEDPLVGFYRDSENRTLDITVTGDKGNPYRLVYTSNEEGAEPVARTVTEEQLEKVLGQGYTKDKEVGTPEEAKGEPVKEPEEADSTEAEEGVNAVKQTREAKAKARLEAIKAAEAARKEADNLAWETLSKDKRTVNKFLNEFSDSLDSKSIDGMITLLEKDIQAFADIVYTAAGDKVENANFIMKKTKAKEVSKNALTLLADTKKFIEKGCK